MAPLEPIPQQQQQEEHPYNDSSGWNAATAFPGAAYPDAHPAVDPSSASGHAHPAVAASSVLVSAPEPSRGPALTAASIARAVPLHMMSFLHERAPPLRMQRSSSLPDNQQIAQPTAAAPSAAAPAASQSTLYEASKAQPTSPYMLRSYSSDTARITAVVSPSTPLGVRSFSMPVDTLAAAAASAASCSAAAAASPLQVRDEQETRFWAAHVWSTLRDLVHVHCASVQELDALAASCRAGLANQVASTQQKLDAVAAAVRDRQKVTAAAAVAAGAVSSGKDENEERLLQLLAQLLQIRMQEEREAAALGMQYHSPSPRSDNRPSALAVSSSSSSSSAVSSPRPTPSARACQQQLSPGSGSASGSASASRSPPLALALKHALHKAFQHTAGREHHSSNSNSSSSMTSPRQSNATATAHSHVQSPPALVRRQAPQTLLRIPVNNGYVLHAFVPTSPMSSRPAKAAKSTGSTPGASTPRGPTRSHSQTRSKSSATTPTQAHMQAARGQPMPLRSFR